VRVNLGALWKIGAWTVNAARSDSTASRRNCNRRTARPTTKTEVKPTAITDLEVSYQFNRAWTLSVGANNLFNQYPDQVNASCWPSSAPTWTTRGHVYPSFSPFGINGGYYYARAGGLADPEVGAALRGGLFFV
jgi:iron complex outermembrane receptor protein